MSKLITSKAALSFPNRTIDPFLFMVYHKDHYPAGDLKMQAPIRGDGAHFDPTAPYRMYHGDRVPGFPQHPHRGFETITATLEGLVDHTDSLGNAGRYGQGDLQWMTAGKGIVHGEMFPLLNMDKGNTTKFFQIWLNLPGKDKFAPPTYVMHWAEKIPKSEPTAGGQARVWAGTLGDKTGLPPPPHSWASDPNNEVAVWHLELNPNGGAFTLPPAKGGNAIGRMAYFVEGKELKVGDETMKSLCSLTLDASQPAELVNPHGSETAEILILQGRPINEPVAQRGPFVMNTSDEIAQAFHDYRQTQFGGWPWPEDAMVFPRDKGRFSSMKGGVEERPGVSEQ